MKPYLRALFRNNRWIVAAVVITLIFGTMAAVTQQILRWSADDPQVQIAKDVAIGLNKGQTPGELVDGHVDVESSLAPFVIVYDQAGQIVTGSGYLNGAVPVIPSGVLDRSRGAEYHRVTWEPRPGTRIASVTVAADRYYVVGGRSLWEVDRRIKYTLQLVVIGWLFSITTLFAAAWYQPGASRTILTRRVGKTKRRR